ncbi:sulfotransferase [Vibrio sp. TBV020]|uniref:sulfotransferase n=1 Tax=Vibrio sp. TBV020 TaxID=3137398 RepID=UPI0038CD62AA
MSKIFCISLQRSGTKSVGNFLRDNGIKVCTYKNAVDDGIIEMAHDYRLNELLDYIETSEYDAFEDSPWWHNDIYKFLFHNLPDSKFILLERDAKKWFDSMIKHSDGNHPGLAIRHAEVYRRLGHLEWKSQFIDNFNYVDTREAFKITESRDYYLQFHCTYHDEINAYFKLLNADNRLYFDKLETHSWKGLARFCGINKWKLDYSSVHSHKTNKSLSDTIKLAK